jgi:hypothetical protein
MKNEELRDRFYGQLPMIASMMVPDDEDYDPLDVARQALELIQACIDLMEEES